MKISSSSYRDDGEKEQSGVTLLHLAPTTTPTPRRRKVGWRDGRFVVGLDTVVNHRIQWPQQLDGPIRTASTHHEQRSNRAGAVGDPVVVLSAGQTPLYEKGSHSTAVIGRDAVVLRLQCSWLIATNASRV